jgi:hypothetical protein
MKILGVFVIVVMVGVMVAGDGGGDGSRGGCTTITLKQILKGVTNKGSSLGTSRPYS